MQVSTTTVVIASGATLGALFVLAAFVATYNRFGGPDDQRPKQAKERQVGIVQEPCSALSLRFVRSATVRLPACCLLSARGVSCERAARACLSGCVLLVVPLSTGRRRPLPPRLSRFTTRRRRPRQRASRRR